MYVFKILCILYAQVRKVGRYLGYYLSDEIIQPEMTCRLKALADNR